MSARAPDGDELRLLERRWQDRVGHTLLDRPFEERGSAMVFERQFSRVERGIDGLRPGPLLEVGCGRGQLLRYLRGRPDHADRLLVGVDVSIATRVLEERGAVGVQADGEHLPFRDGVAAAVVYNGALHHVVDFRAAIREAWRVLAPGGRLVVFEPVSSAFSQLAHRLLDPIVFRSSCEYESPVDLHLKHEFAEEAVDAELDALGARVVLRGKSDFLAYPFTGCYAGAWFTRSPRFMRGLLAAEGLAERVPGLRRVARLLAWRFLVVAEKPRGGDSAAGLGGDARSRPPAPDALLDPALEALLACPRCRGDLVPARGGVAGLRCDACHVAYRVEERVPVLLSDEATAVAS